MFDGGAMVAPNPYMDGESGHVDARSRDGPPGGHGNYWSLSAKMPHITGPSLRSVDCRTTALRVLGRV